MTFESEHLTMKSEQINKQNLTMNRNAKVSDECGQIVLVLILVMTVALAIGIAVIQRSLSDISTASKVEQSSRAFSAAEAGIEQALNCPTCTNVDFSGNQSEATVTIPVDSTNGLIPAIPGTLLPSLQDPFECLTSGTRFAKEDVAQVWLADLNSPVDPPTAFYKQSSIDVYWGNSATDIAALEVTIVYYDGSQYQNKKWFLDQTDRGNNFDYPGKPSGVTPITCSDSGFKLVYSDGTDGSTYRCTVRINSLPTAPAKLMLLRARLLYNSTSQPFAVQATGTCNSTNTDACIPPQAKTLVSTGKAGQTQRKVQICQLQKVAPPYLDYAIFSSGTIAK